MPYFKHGQETSNRLDWQLIRNGQTVRYHKMTTLSDDLKWLKYNGYSTYEVDCSTWKNQADFHHDMKRVLNFPDYYGKNLDAFNDCLRDLIPDSNPVGAVIVFHKFDSFLVIDERLCLSILDILANRSRDYQLYGQTLITIIQTDDGNLNLPLFGRNYAVWNPKEWLIKDRES